MIGSSAINRKKMKIGYLSLIFAAVNIGSNAHASQSPGLRTVVDPDVALSDGSDEPPRVLGNLIKFERCFLTVTESEGFKSSLDKVPKADNECDYVTLMAGVEAANHPPPLKKKICVKDLTGAFAKLMGEEERKEIKEDRLKNPSAYLPVAAAAFVGAIPEGVKMPPRGVIRVEQFLCTKEEIKTFIDGFSANDKEVCNAENKFAIGAKVVGDDKPPMKAMLCGIPELIKLSEALEAEEERSIEENRFKNRNEYERGQFVIGVIL